MYCCPACSVAWVQVRSREMLLSMFEILPDERPGSRVFKRNGSQCWPVESVLGKEVVWTEEEAKSEQW